MRVWILLLALPALLRAGFVDVTQEAFDCAPGELAGAHSVSWPDLNGDGWPDLFLSPCYFYLNNSDGTFTLRDPADISGVITWAGQHRAAFADADSDGDLDFVLASHNITTTGADAYCYYFENLGPPEYLFAGEIIYTFPLYVRAGQPLFLDGDADGDYEIYLSMFGNWEPYAIGTDRYFELDGEGSWQDVTETRLPQLADTFYRRPARGCNACDYDNDFDIDIFVPNYGISYSESWYNMLWQNDGSGLFTDYAEEADVQIEPHGRYGIGLASGAAFGDWNSDGWFDLCVGNIHGWAALYINNRDGTFTNETEGSGLPTTGAEKQWHNTSWTDYDNDGDPDLFLTQWYGDQGFVDYLYRNEAPVDPGSFSEVSQELGFNWNQEFNDIGGMAHADYDRDGDLDICFYTYAQGQTGNYLFRNDLAEEDNHWLVLSLAGNGTSCGLTALGAQARVYFPDGAVSGVRQVESTTSDESMHMHPLHFGLGEQVEFHQIEVRWLDGTTEYWDFQSLGGTVDQWFTLEQGSGSPLSTILHVDISNEGVEDGSPAHPFNTIQEGIDAAATGYLILIHPGSYEENLSLSNLGVTLSGAGGEAAPVIDGGGAGSVVAISGGDNEVRLNRLILTGGEATGGGAIFGSDCNLKIFNLLIHANSAGYGGGIALLNSTILEAEHCTFVNNSAESGGALCVEGSSGASIINALIWDNTSPAVFENNGIVEITYSDIQGGWEGEGNLELIPRFVDPEGADYHLMNFSPCLGAGSSAFQSHSDLDGAVRPAPAGSSPDLGACENSRAQAAPSTLHVSVDGSDETGDGSETNPLRTIQHALNLAIGEDTVLVHPGTYPEQLDFLGKPTTVASLFLITCDPAYIRETVVDGGQSGSVVLINTNETAASILCGLTITGGSAPTGGGIYCSGATPLLHNLVLYGNYASGSGSGLFCINAAPLLYNVNVVDNSGGNCGGITCLASEIDIINSIIRDNELLQIMIYSGEVNVFYSNVVGGWTGEGNVDVNPLFADAAGGNYSLLDGSPCIDAGVAFLEHDGEVLLDLSPAEYYGAAPDMGALEWDPLQPVAGTDVEPLTCGLSCYPNPFNSLTTLDYTLNRAAWVELEVFDLLGRRVCSLVNARQEAGRYTVTFDGRDLASGLYFYILKTEEQQLNRKMVLLK